ncbi:GH15913 [Drosophila grimshawi]|uniref:GH15913 n=1 Tax=Drosophila grimshawi TaxID=7222 RepID=B4J1C6_DROGR|nr:GH15913 [Drosophila grimshawi]
MLQGKDNSDEPPIKMEKLAQPRPLGGMVIPPESMLLDSKCDGDVGGLCSTPSIKTETEELPNSQKKEKPEEHQPHLPVRRGGKVMPHDRMSSGSPYAAPTSDAEAELLHRKKEPPRQSGKLFAWQYMLMKSRDFDDNSSSSSDDDDDGDDDDGDGKDDADDGGDDDDGGGDDDGGVDDDDDEDDENDDDDFDETSSSSDAYSSSDSEEGDKPRGGKRIKLHSFKRKAPAAEPLLNQADSSTPDCVPVDTPTSIAQMAEETERDLQEEDVQIT